MNINGKKILVVTTTDNMIWQFLVPHIKHFEEQGAIVDCVCAKTGFFFDELINKFKINVIDINFTRFPFTFKNFKARQELITLCKKNRYDLIYCHQPVGGVMGRMMGKIFNIPVVYVAHGFHFYKGCPLKNKILYKTIENHYSKYTKALVTMNEEDFEVSKKMKAEQNYKINGIGVDLERYRANMSFDEKAFKDNVGIDEKDFVVLSIGELNKNKNTLMILESIKILKDFFAKKNKNFNIKYVVCGQGKLQQEFLKKIHNYQLSGNVIMAGFQKEICKYIQTSDVFLMPSLREGLPKSMMECMAQGKPIICSNIRGCRDLVGNNEGGILCDAKSPKEFAEAIKKLMEDKNFYSECSKRNLKEIENYSLNNVIIQLDKIIEKI